MSEKHLKMVVYLYVKIKAHEKSSILIAKAKTKISRKEKSLKSHKRKIEEGRCQGYGKDYTPFILVREYKGRGTASVIWDPFEERLIHCLSQTEVAVYETIRWQDNVEHIREQYLLDTDRMNAIAEELGMKKAPWWTTDFLVDYDDGSKTAFSVKYDRSAFDPNKRTYRGKESRLHNLVMRQRAEQIYWESQKVRFKLVTNEDINQVLVWNVKSVMSYYESFKVISKEQKLKYLIAHKYVYIPMDKQILDFHEIVERAGFDVDELYKRVLVARDLHEEITERR